MRKYLLSALLLSGAAIAMGEIPEGYYSTLDGKSGVALRRAVAALADGHKTVTYNTKTWGAFETTDVREIAGRQAWWDMYSNNLVWLPDHASLNIEHSVANSWWGGKSGSTTAYSDLFHLNPADQNANNKKGSYPPGMVADPRILDNGLLLIGTPVEGQGGGATSVFEPADEYKGDFARAYFYIFATYADLNWDDQYAYVYTPGDGLQPWAVSLLLEWSAADPVDSKEAARNEEIYRIQGNRNPFIDNPDLEKHIWGSLKEEPYLSGLPRAVTDRPATPTFRACRMSNVNTYTKPYWEPFDLAVEGSRPIMASIDGAAFEELAEPVIHIDGAEANDEYRKVRVYSFDRNTGLRSSISTVTLRASDPTEPDATRTDWALYTSQTGTGLTDHSFVMISSNLLHILATDGGTATRAFMESAGFPDFEPGNEDKITMIPDGSAIVNFENVSGGKYALRIDDIHGNTIGYWNATEAKKMRIDPVTYTPGEASADASGTFTMDFGTAGTLQFNQSQPRFLNYTSSQKPVSLFYRLPGTGTGLETITDKAADWKVGIEGGCIIAPQGAVVTDLQGRKINGTAEHGIYIVLHQGRSLKIRL